MIPAGGPSAIYGFLFQVLRTAEWALRIDLRAPQRNISDVTIIAEPRGGDIEIRLPHEVLVQQFKVRHGRRWTLTNVVDNVLPDLYLAVKDDRQSARYELATNGAMGNWGAALDFFRSLNERPVAQLEGLDDSLKKFQLRQKRLTERSLFEEIVHLLRRRGSARNDSEEVTRRKLWRLLGRFDFVRTGDSAEAQRNVRHLLSTYVLDDDRLDDKVARLVQTVLTYSSEGNRSFTPEELLSDSEIRGVSFTKLPLAREALRLLTVSDMRRLVRRYEPSLSVRKPMTVAQTDRILVLSGESGQGKSWALADLAHDLMERDPSGFVVFARATGDLTKDLTLAAQRVVCDALGHSTYAPFEQLATKIRKDTPSLGDPWLTVCLDDVRSSSEVIAICDAPLEEWGIRVVMTALPRQAAHGSLAARGASVVAIRDFSDPELRVFLSRHGREWGTIPPDVRKTMRRPLLADIFVRLAKQWRPRNEYDLYNAVWQRLFSAGEQTDHPADPSALLALADDFRKGGGYPWPPSALRRLGVSGQEQSRLEAIGWFTRVANGAVKTWHDRLLNWAVAEKIAEEIPELRRGSSSLAEVLRPYVDDDPAESERPRLLYVPMDVLWMAANRKLLSPADLSQVIEELESTSYHETSTLYRLLGSIGPKIIPGLIERVHRAETRDDQHGIEMLVRAAVRDALRDSGGEAESHVRLLLNDASETLRNIGVIAAAEHPAAAHVPRLWELLLEHDQRASTGTAEVDHGPGDLYWRRERLTTALAASVAFAPKWLEAQVATVAQNDPHATTLAWMLASLKGAEGRRLWLNVKGILFEKTPREKPGGLIACIRNFRDKTEIPTLEAWLTSEYDFAAPSALGALSVIAPERAIAFITSGSYTPKSFFASWWFPWLMLVRKDETLALARDRLDKNDGTAPDWFHGSEEHLDAATARALVAQLTDQLREFLAAPPPERSVAFAHTTRVLAAAAHVEVLDVLAAYRGSEFEQRLIAAAERLPYSDHERLSHEGADVRTILRRVSDAGSARVIASAIERAGPAPIAIIDWAAGYPVDEVRNALRTFVKRCAEGWDGKSIPHRVTRTMRSLALIGDDHGVLDAISIFGANAPDDDLPWLLGRRAPMDEALVKKLVAALASPSTDKQCRALSGLRLSGHRNLVPMLLEHAHSEDAAVRWHALRAARDLIERGVEIASLVRDLVEGEAGEDRHIFAELLRRSGTPTSMHLLEQLARKLPFNHVHDHTVLCLVDRSPRGKAMAELLEKHMPPFPHTGLFRQEQFNWSRLLPALDRDDLRQKALDVAGVPMALVNPLSVIESVATFDAEAAFEFAASALRSDVKGRDVLPPYLLKYNAARAVDTLLRYLPDERSGPVRWSIARTLRWSADASLTERIDEMWSNPSPGVRAAACDIAGWMPALVDDKRLHAAALSDEDQHVSIAARDALDRRLRLRQAGVLRDRLVNSAGAASWMLAEALATYADPFLLERHSDPLSIDVALETKSRAIRVMTEQWLEERRKDVERDAEREDYVRGRSSF